VVTRLLDEGRYEAAWHELLALTRRATHYTNLVPLCRLRQRLLALHARPPAVRTVRVAVLGNATTRFIEEPLALELAACGIDCELYASNYNTAAWEVLDESSPLIAFRPEVALIVNTPANLSQWPEPGERIERVRERASEVCDLWLGLCARLHERTGCDIVLDNLHVLPIKPLGNLAATTPWDVNAFIRRINVILGERAESYVHISDVDTLASQHGVRRWFDPRYWYHAKQPVSMDCLLPYVRNAARIIAATFGRTAKCLVLDLDNTLWDGVVGDVGVEGIRIGVGDPIGEAYLEFQRYVLSLKHRGVLLAACSKNDEEVALRPFVERVEMLLRRDDFVAFKANWRTKSDNLSEIAAELNIGTDTLVFVDDNPAEREHVRLQLPEVLVVELTDDPADYPRLLDDAAPFEVIGVTDEDRTRDSLYRSNTQRESLRKGVGNYTDYLATLQQRAVIRPFEEQYLDRITQLINKTNQFNLTTERMTASAVAAAMRDPQAVTAYVRLADRFGDNGLICVVIARLLCGEALIQQWLMSCRVLNRGVEAVVLDYLAAQMQRLQIESLRGLYRPTARNALVRQHYQSLGFSLAAEKDNGETEWTLQLRGYTPRTVSVALVDGY